MKCYHCSKKLSGFKDKNFFMVDQSDRIVCTDCIDLVCDGSCKTCKHECDERIVYP